METRSLVDIRRFEVRLGGETDSLRGSSYVRL